MSEFMSNLAEWAATTGIKILIALVVLLIAFRIINLFSRKISGKLEATGKVDQTLTRALTNVTRIGLKILVVICLIGYLGIETGGISALIASLGVCVGLAVNGTLSNLAGGVMILITRPFKVGDYVSAQGNEGTIEDISICYTKILTVDNKAVYLPNSALSTGVIVNFSEEDLRRVDLDFTVGGNDPALVRSVLLDVCEKEELVKADPAPFARITDFGAGNGTKVTLRAWCDSAAYWDAYFALLDDVQKAFDEAGIVVPISKMEVHIKND